MNNIVDAILLKASIFLQMRTVGQVINMGKTLRSSARTSYGAVMVEGVVMLSLMTVVSVGLIFLILHSGVVMLHKQKLGFIAAQAANFFIFQSTGWEYQNNPSNPDVNTFAKSLAQPMGFNPNSITATASRVGPIVNVTVVGTNLPLVPGSFLPNFITVRDTFSANTNIFPRPTGLVSLTPINTAGVPQVIIPCYSNSPPHVPPPGMYDQWSFFVLPSSPGQGYTPGNRGTTP